MANISSYNQLSSWNEDDDLLFVQQPDAPKKAHPSQMKEYILRGLDVSSVGGSGKYISAISETDGKINATAETMDTAPTEGSSKAVTSGGIKTAIDNSVSLKTATGNPITLTDAANANAEKLLMTIEPIQSGSGDPSPTNVRPISGISEAVVNRLGKNLLCGRIFGKAINASGVFVESLESTMCYAQVIEGETYKITSHDPTNQLLCAYYYEEPTVASVSYNQSRIVENNSNFTVTAPITGYIAFRVYNSVDNEAQIELGTISTDYEAPVTPATASITLDQTVYGGSVNFKTGEVTVTHGMVDLGSLNWVSWSTYGFRTEDLNNVIKATDNSTPINAISSEAIILSWSQYAANTDNTLKFALYKDANAMFIVGGRDMSYADAAAFKTAMSGVQLCYELATPTTLTLTPAELELLKGNNTVSGNGAEISLSYYPDNAIGALAGRVDNKADITYVNNKVKKLATRTIQYISTSTDLEYTGVNVSCPTGHTYIVRAKCDWDNGYTQSIAASDSSTDVSTWRRFAYGDSAYITFMLNEGETAYIWGKWSVAGKNRVHLSITDITI